MMRVQGQRRQEPSVERPVCPVARLNSGSSGNPSFMVKLEPDNPEEAFVQRY